MSEEEFFKQLPVLLEDEIMKESMFNFQDFLISFFNRIDEKLEKIGDSYPLSSKNCENFEQTRIQLDT